MKEHRRIAALLAALIVLGGLLTVPALATEEAEPLTGYTEMPEESTGGETGEPEPPVSEDPTPEPPPASSDPPVESEPPVSEPPVSSGSESSGESSSSEGESSSSEGESSSGDGWEGGDTSSDWEDPSSDSEDDYPWEGEISSSSSQLESEEPEEESSQQEPVPSVDLEPIATPRPALERPQVSLNTQSGSSSAQEGETGPNYVTFARLNVQSNALASSLFFAGVGCIAAGVLGLAAVLVFYLRGRRRYAGAEGILEEIHQAEVRQQPEPPQPAQPPQPAPQPPAAPKPAPVPAPQPPAPARPTPPPGAVVPQEVSLYTEEFSLPPEEAYEDAPYLEEEDGYLGGEGFEEPYQAYREDYPEDAYYDDGYFDEDEYAADAAEYPADPPKAASQKPAAPEPDQDATRTFNTEEILREALRYSQDDDPNCRG